MKRYIVPFAVIATALVVTDRRTAEALPNTRDQVLWSGRVSQMGAPYTLAGVSVAVGAIGRIRGDKHASKTGWLGLQALAHTELLVLGMKQITNRRRPLQNGGGLGFWHGGDSFPSGHAATSFAVATVFAYEYRDHIGVSIAAYSVAGLVSASRVGARRHWFSDAFVGGSAGFLIGRFMYKQRHDPRLPVGAANHRRVSCLMPELGVGRYGPALIWRL